MASISERIRELRSASGLTQEELATKLQVSKGTIGNYETGTRTPNAEMQSAIADIFNVDLDYLNGRQHKRPEFSLEEKWLIDCFRSADEFTREGIKLILRNFDKGKG